MAPITPLSQLDPTGSYTYADYLTWKFDEFVELVKGRLLRPMAGPSRLHQVYFGNIFGEPRQFLKDKPCQVYAAPFDVRLTTAGVNGDQQITTVVQPDICVVCAPAKLDDRGCLGAPDWIVEILSPGNTARDTKIKFDLYERKRRAGILAGISGPESRGCLRARSRAVPAGGRILHARPHPGAHAAGLRARVERGF